MAVLGMRTMTEIHYEALSRQETLADLLAVLGGIALLLAATGVSGVLSYFVSQRTYEIGIRAALGADRRSLVRLFVRQGMAMTMGGTVLGLAGAWALARVVRGRLHEVSPTDPLSFAGAALLLIGIVLIASYFPARRAASVDPLVAIRE
jgi:ABC-type antimicrobial peptide transport system permease subunit